MKKHSVELLINTKSKKGKDALTEILDVFKHLGTELTAVNKITNSQELRSALKTIKKRSPQILVVASGDGTVSEVVDYLAGTEIKLGIIPLGTTNNFARSLGLPLDIAGSIEVVKTGNASWVDLGRIEDDYFSNVAGIGLSALIAKNVTNVRKRRFGRLAYAITGALLLFRHKSFFVTVADKDKELQLHFETHQVIVANGRFHAGKEIAADASLNSRELIIFKLGGRSKMSFIWHLLDFYFGKRRNIYHSSYLIGKNVSITTSTPQLVELDGEVKTATPISAEVSARALQVIHP